MTYSVIYLPDALSDLQKLLQTLELVSPITIPKLRGEIRRVERQLTIFPLAYQRVENSTYRRVILYTCRYTVYFHMNDFLVEIVSILPQMIDPDALTERGIVH